MMPVWDQNILIAGDSGRRNAGEQILSEIVRMPKESRELVIVDLKEGELARWAKCANAYAGNMGEAEQVLWCVANQAARRFQEDRDALVNDFVWVPDTSNRKQIFVYLNDLEALTRPLSNEEEEQRERAFALFEKILYRGHGLIVPLIAESSDVTKLERRIAIQFREHILGYANTPMTVAKMFGGHDNPVDWGCDPARLKDNWVIVDYLPKRGGRPFSRVRIPDGSNLDAVSSDPRYFVPEDARIPLEPLDGHGDPRDVCLWES